MKAPRKQFKGFYGLRFRLEYYVLNALTYLIPLFPRRFIAWIGCSLGTLAYLFWKSGREVALENLTIAFGDTKSLAEKKRIVRASMRQMASTLFTLFWSPSLTRENFFDYAVVDEAQTKLFHDLVHRGKGVICVTLHYGEWEMLGIAAGFIDIAVTIVQEAMRNESLESIFARLRSVSGNRIVPNRYIATALYKTLRKKESIALLSDQNATRNRGGEWFPFFGLPTFTTNATGWLAVHTGAAIMMGASYPLPNGKVKLVFGPEIICPRTGNDEADARAINEACIRASETTIRDHPEYWMWCYKRWSYRLTPERGPFPSYSRYVAVVAPPDGVVPSSKP